MSRITHEPPAPVAEAVARLGRNIRWARERRGLTQIQLAEIVGISRRTQVKIEQGKPGTSLAVYLAVLSALGLLDSFEKVADPDSDRVGIMGIGRAGPRARGSLTAQPPLATR